MFTVVFAEQEHLDRIREYGSFLSPLFSKKNVAFCRWVPGASTLEEAAPTLMSVVENRESWRAVVVCDADGSAERNPFDLVPFEMPKRPDHTGDVYVDLVQDEAYYTHLASVKETAYKRAAEKPLVKLATWLCPDPMLSSSQYCVSQAQAEKMKETQPHEYVEYLRLQEYRREAEKKQYLRQSIRGKKPLTISRPTEMVCIALRCSYDKEDFLIDGWSSHQEHEYSRFCDRNMYFDQMRFLVFDILESSHKNYMADYLRFLYALLIFANHEVPVGTFSPSRVYCLQCEENTEVLCRLLTSYDARLVASQELLDRKIYDVESSTPPDMTDRDAEAAFCSNTYVRASAQAEEESEQMHISSSGLGLSADCPTSEENTWLSARVTADRALGKFLRKARRGVAAAVGEVPYKNKADLSSAERLNANQLEDIRLYTDEEEIRLVSTGVRDLSRTEGYREEIEEADKQVRRVLDRRMTKAKTLLVGITALFAALLAMLPLFFTVADPEKRMVLILLAVVLGVPAVLAIVEIICLFCLRHPLKKAYSQYNGTVSNVEKSVFSAMDSSAEYLSHACNMMRGYSVLNHFEDNPDPRMLEVSVYQKHKLDIEQTRLELREVFGQYLLNNGPERDNHEDYFDYDYKRAVDYQYPIVFMADQETWIDFLQTGNQIEIPIGFVKNLTVRREELYD